MRRGTETSGSGDLVTNPYPGARAFGEADEAVFFGRTSETRAVRSLWLSTRILVLHGPAAVGKSSLLHAGVIPAIRAAGDADVRPVERVSADLASTAGFFRGLSREGKPAPLLAAIDQLEDVFTPSAAGAGDRDRLFDELTMLLAANPALRLVLVIRTDWLPALAQHDHVFAGYVARYFSLEPLDEEAALEAITRPAAHAKRRFADHVAQQLATDLRTATVADATAHVATVHFDRTEPLLLQIACASLWASLPAEGGPITANRLRAWGGVDTALADFVDAAVSDTVGRYNVGEVQLRDWLQRTFVTQLGTRNSVRRGLVATAELPTEIADALTSRLLLTAEYRDQAVWYQLGHDRLAHVLVQANRAWRRARGLAATPTTGSGTATGLQATAEAAFGEGNLVIAERNIAEAAEQYRESGDLRRFADARALHGEIARAAGDLTDAERHFRAAMSVFLVLEDQYSAARLLSAMADLRYMVGDYTEAAELNRHAVERMPGDVRALTGLAYAQWRGGSPADAEATFDQALRWENPTALALAGRGQVRADLGQYEYALEDLDRALRLQLAGEAETDARSARALALAGLGRLTEAREELAATLRIDPERARSRLRAGRIAAIIGDEKNARAELEQALRGQPSLSSVEEESARRILRTLDVGAGAARR